MAVPEGLSLIAVELEPQRVLGSRLRAGDTVGVIVSLKVKEAGSSDEVALSHTIADRVLVARVQGAVAPSNATPAPGSNEKAPGNAVIVTLAVDAQLAEKVAFGQEFGKIWLAVQGEGSVTGGTTPVDAGVLFR